MSMAPKGRSRGERALARATGLARSVSWRHVLALALGAYFALQAVVIVILSAIAVDRTRRLNRARIPHIDQPDILVEENRVKIFSSGADLFEAMYEAIDSAQEHIFIESYIWKADAVGHEVKRRLVAKARQGVKVYVIFDEFGNLVVPAAFKDFPPELETLRFKPINRPWHILDPRRYALDHRKLLVVDGRVAFLGGYNIGQLYADHWRDTHLRIVGPAAYDIADSFCDFWNDHSPRSRHLDYRFPQRFAPAISLRDNNALRLTFPIRDMYIAAINRAQRHILLTNAYFIPDHMLMKSLMDAARRGVAVHILLPWTSNHILADFAARGYFQTCLSAGIHIWGYRNAMIHSKTCTIDDEWSTVGTANLDRLSAVGNYELNTEIYSINVARQMRELFEHDQLNAAEVTAERWERRPWYVKLSEWTLAPLRLML